MQLNVRKSLAVVGIVGVLALAVVLAVGNITWRPAANVTASESALTVDPLIESEQLLQQEGVGEPSQELLSALYNSVLPSVVNVQVTQGLVADPNLGVPGMPAQGQGSGWVWDTEGHIITNNHVVENATQITVFFYNGLWASAELIATDPQADLAVLQVEAPSGIELIPLPVAAEVPPVGHYALAFGSPFGLSGTMTKGIISAVGRSFPVGDGVTPGSQYSLPDVIQTDAAINPGNSGGPLINLNGEVVGVNFAIRSEVRANAGVGFAIPVEIVSLVVPALIDDGAYAYPYLGLAGGTITPQIAMQEDIPEGTLGVFVASLAQDGPSETAGLQEGDIITGINDESVTSFEDLIGYLISETQPGDTVELQVLRDGEEQILSVTVGERPTTATRPVQQVTVGQAIDIASDAALEAQLLSSIDSTSASLEQRQGVSVWVVQLQGDGTVVNVAIDTASGEVLSMDIEE